MKRHGHKKSRPARNRIRAGVTPPPLSSPSRAGALPGGGTTPRAQGARGRLEPAGEANEQGTPARS